MVSDVEDAQLGGVSLRDEEKILQILKTAEWGTGLKLETYYHNRASFTASAIRDRLKSLPVQPRDVVFFYYTGLGHYPNANSQFPAFKLKENAMQQLLGRKPALSLDEVGDMLQQKGARLNIVMADCRDTTLEFSIYPGPLLDEDVKEVSLKKLFLGFCGLIKIASAKKGQKVWGDTGNGSLYTFIFNEFAFRDCLQFGFIGVRAATWPQLLKRAEAHPKTFDFNDISINPASIDQTPVFEFGTCTAKQRSNTTTYPSYQNSMTTGAIEGKLSFYKRKGGNYEEVSGIISKAFYPNAEIELKRKNKYPASDPRAKQVAEKMSVANYLAHFKIVANRIEDVKVDATSVERNPNYEYITSLTIIETYKEL
ncbi:caspase family protein [Persicitalea jodogahamensis]|uniref:caspase family protein n=1 Tax=Persicitalea jodogahamensis TaxID=402147 RepID=UPI001674B44E|nr:caspase family protein [Persicitalea jodogahamensis]